MEKNKENFSLVWKRLQTETEISSFSMLAEITGTTQQNISAAKKRGEFPVKWAYIIWVRYGYLVEWIMTGTPPKKLDTIPAREQANVVSTRRQETPAFIRDLETWGREYAGTGNLDWLENLLDTCLPAFKTWRDQKKSAAEGAALHQDQVKVA